MRLPPHFSLDQIKGMKLGDPVPIEGNEENSVTLGELLAISAVHYGQPVQKEVLTYIRSKIKKPVVIEGETWNTNWFELRESMADFSSTEYESNLITMKQAAWFLAKQRDNVGVETVQEIAIRMINLANIIASEAEEIRPERIRIKRIVQVIDALDNDRGLRL